MATSKFVSTRALAHFICFISFLYSALGLLTVLGRLALTARQAADMGLETLQELSVHEYEQPHARPDGDSILRLCWELLCNALVHLLENVMLQ